MVDYDGDDFGTRQTCIPIPEFEGAQHITDLNAFPLELHGEAGKVKSQLIARGRRWESFAGQKFCEYSGIATQEINRDLLRYNIQGRVMIDCKTFHRLETNQAFQVQGFSRASKEAMRKRALVLPPASATSAATAVCPRGRAGQQGVRVRESWHLR